MTEPRQVGIIGLGFVGKALAKRFLEAGWQVSGYDIDAAASDAAQAMGVVVTESVGPLNTCGAVLLCLPTPEATREALWGDRGLARALTTSCVILDTSTTAPKDTCEYAATLAESGVRLIDVCLVGASDAIARGEAVALVGDTEAGACVYRSLLDRIAPRHYFLGSVGAGNSAKLAVNLVLGLNRLALAEGLNFGERLGLDPAQLLAILRAGAAYSRVMDTKGERMLRGDFEPVARLRQHAKDVDLILAAAADAGAKVPLTELHASALGKAMEAGWGDLDNSAVLKVYRESPE